MQNAKIKFKVTLLKGENKGKVIDMEFTLDEIEYGVDGISYKLIEDGHYSSMGWPSDYYRVSHRQIEVFNE